MFAFGTGVSRPNRLKDKKDKSYHTRYAKYCLGTMSNTTYQSFINKSLLNWAFYKGKQWVLEDDLEDCMTKMELRVVRYLARRMGYDNEISGIGYNEMQGDLGSQFRYVKGAIDGLISRNVLKFKVVKNRRVYMLNPSFYYKGNMLGIFRAVKKFSAS